MIIIMIINKILLFASVASFVVYERAKTDAVSDSTFNQYEGLWYDIGRISTCKDDTDHICKMHEVIRNDNSDQHFYHAHIKLQGIVNCEHGVPIYTYTVSETLVDSKINSTGSDGKSSLSSTVESYNNGKELIFTDSESQSCASKSYRLWSRERQVSAETKAEFEKLNGNGIVEYYSWDNCPKSRSETKNEFTLNKFEGLWYGISHIVYGALNNIRVSQNVTVDYENQTFDLITKIGGLSSGIKPEGKIVASKIQIKSTSSNPGNLLFTVISCNNGSDLILAQDRIQNYELMSRNPQVSTNIKTEFEKIAQMF